MYGGRGRERVEEEEQILWICDALLSSYKIIEPERKWKCRALRFALAKCTLALSNDDNRNNQNPYKYTHAHTHLTWTYISYHFSFISFELARFLLHQSISMLFRVFFCVCVCVRLFCTCILCHFNAQRMYIHIPAHKRIWRIFCVMKMP